MVITALTACHAHEANWRSKPEMERTRMIASFNVSVNWGNGVETQGRKCVGSKRNRHKSTQSTCQPHRSLEFGLALVGCTIQYNRCVFPSCEQRELDQALRTSNGCRNTRQGARPAPRDVTGLQRRLPHSDPCQLQQLSLGSRW